MTKIYELRETDQYGENHSSGFYFKKENAENEKKKLDRQPGNLNYCIKQHIISHEMSDDID